MAAIDKIYLNYNDAKVFLNWVKENDYRFVEEFKESKCPTILSFFYVNEKTVDERYEDGLDKEHPVCNLPIVVEKWLLRQDIPDAVRKELYLNYGFNELTEEEVNEILAKPLEEVDERPYGKHVKIIKRNGILANRNKFSKCNALKLYFDTISSYYYECNGQGRFKSLIQNAVGTNDNDQIEEYFDSLNRDSYWWCEQTDSLENWNYRKKKNIWTDKTSCLGKGRKSIKAIIREIIKLKFPVGTIINIFSLRYVGEMTIIVTK